MSEASQPIPRLEENWALWTAARQAHAAHPDSQLSCNEEFMRALDHFRRAAEAKQLPGAAGVEMVCWITEGLPDDERTVLINVVTEDVALVRDGFCSEGKWHDGDGWEIRRGTVLAWSEKPKGLAAWRLASAGAAL